MKDGPFVERGHLGGYREGGDSATYYPDLWRALVDELGVQSMIDVGCGEGHARRFFEDLGCSAMGVEGVPQGLASIATHDFTTGPFLPLSRFDLCWCCEFVEHIAAEYVPNFLATFDRAKMVLMTHADLGQDGYHHVNCQPASYWERVMGEAGFSLDHDLTFWSRALAGKNTSPWNHYVRSGLAFVK